MASDRLTLLKQFYEDDPKDPFNIYSLALEYVKLDKNKARELFSILIDEHENYVPTYYQAAKLLEEIGDRHGAIAVYKKGIERAKINNDQKAFRELTSAYNELLFDD